jgi:hypothetical protein
MYLGLEKNVSQRSAPNLTGPSCKIAMVLAFGRRFEHPKFANGDGNSSNRRVPKERTPS